MRGHHRNDSNKVDLNNNIQNWLDQNFFDVYSTPRQAQKDRDNNRKIKYDRNENKQYHDKTKEDIVQIVVVSMTFQKNCSSVRVSSSLLAVASKWGREIPTNINLFLLFQNKKRNEFWGEKVKIFWSSTHTPPFLSKSWNHKERKRRKRKEFEPEQQSKSPVGQGSRLFVVSFIFQERERGFDERTWTIWWEEKIKKKQNSE